MLRTNSPVQHMAKAPIRPIPAVASACAAANPLDALNGFATKVQIRRGQEIYGEGDPARFCYKVLSGSVRALKVMADGRRQICEFRLPGDFLGFESQGEYYFGAEAVTDTVLLSYPRSAVDRLRGQNPALDRAIRQLTTLGLQSAYQRMVLLTHKSAEERMAWFLLDLADRVSAKSTIELPMSRSDIADYLGMVIETVSRVLSKLKSAGTIAMKSVNSVQLLDRDLLEDMRGEFC